uniref:Uncharacterized protein n=1 Tax=Fagus sylvatica TaxID=28930 RepID=A0A2N9G3M2_FAGSY
MVSRTEVAGVFLVHRRAFFRRRFQLDRGKPWRSESSTPCMNVSSFQRARACGSTCCESRRLCAQARQRRGKSYEIFSMALFCRPVFVRMVDVAPDVGFRRSWCRRKACATYFLKGSFSDRDSGLTGGALDDPEVARRGGQFNPVFGLINSPVKPRSNLVKALRTLGNTWSNFGKCVPELLLGVIPTWWALVGLGRLGLGCLILRVDTRENPGGKNGVMTPTKLFRRLDWEHSISKGWTTNPSNDLGMSSACKSPSGLVERYQKTLAMLGVSPVNPQMVWRNGIKILAMPRSSACKSPSGLVKCYKKTLAMLGVSPVNPQMVWRNGIKILATSRSSACKSLSGPVERYQKTLAMLGVSLVNPQMVWQNGIKILTTTKSSAGESSNGAEERQYNLAVPSI